ncbi:putative inactive receptor kinase RLK902 [Tasmannia lanceolata]|uniref:putative inactive receptor kinase RLK902 n=1 Tax=Tasmannia lanceolata TaxID=3420 RepID=UPI0040632716
MASRLLILFFFLFFLHHAKPDIESDKTALLSLKSAVGRFLKWNETDTPCKWPGVECESGHVSVLRLPGTGLMGNIPPQTIGNLTNLRTLSLRFNALTGQIPSDLSSCTELRNLYLQGNQFSGEIPALLFQLKNLVRLNLAGNNFSGEIPAGFNQLKRLGTLYLEKNRLSGLIPDLNLPNLVQFNVSFNQLNGSIPASLRRMKIDSFEGNSLCGGPMIACSSEGTMKKNKKLSAGAIAGIAIGSVVAFMFIILIICIVCRRDRNGARKTRSVEAKPPEFEFPVEKSGGEGENGSVNGGLGGGEDIMVNSVKGGDMIGNSVKKLVFVGNGSARVFDLEDLLRASAEVLGKGSFGTAYKAILEVGIVVAVKRLKDVGILEDEFREKIETVGLMDHENLVPLRAYYFSKDEKLLVYDYLPMGSLSALLHGNRGAGRTPLNWETRSGIALGAARGIEYLHRQGPNVSHGNIKSSNVLLTKSYDARVSDFGLAHLVGPNPTPNRIDGYRAPEVTDGRKVSQKADVYSFGVLLLELLTGKAPTHALLNEEGVDLPRWVQSVVREEWTSEVFDLELLRYQSVEEDMVQLLQLAIDCTAQYPDKRPSMSEVVQRMEELCHSSLHQERDQNMHPVDDPDGSFRQIESGDGSGHPQASHLD